jgi:hypothetical protein
MAALLNEWLSLNSSGIERKLRRLRIAFIRHRV